MEDTDLRSGETVAANSSENDEVSEFTQKGKQINKALSRKGGAFYSAMRGHFNTLAPFVRRSVRPLQRPLTEAWSTELLDPAVGPVSLSGRLMKRSKKRLLLVVHGLGGNSESVYMGGALTAAFEAGDSALLLNCRGADRSGSDVYHSGLIADIEAALKSPELAEYERIDILGYSIGGHLALRYACTEPEARVGRVAAICSPLHLASSAVDFDAPKINIYRSHVMDGLKEIYTAAYQRNPQGLLPQEARKITRIREWDHKIIAPRFGFQSAEHYYETQSAGPRLEELKRETLYVGATHDPMVRASAVLPYLQVESPLLTHVWDEQAGHLGFAAEFDLGQTAALGLESQVLAWLSR